NLFGAFGRDFVTRDGQRLMVVAITPRQWTGLIEVLGVGEAVAAVEAARGADFSKDEGVRFAHADVLMPIFEAGFARAQAADLLPSFEQLGVCWGPYQTLRQAQEDPRLFKGNPIFSDLTQVSGQTYPVPGYAATLPQDVRAPARPAARLGQHTEEVLAERLGLVAGEIARLHDAGIVASA
ncbi:MAG: CoA transferase, partial [Phenylobacterium sp.]|nr:CoA transferase [Phenylobacterium sp.]